MNYAFKGYESGAVDFLHKPLDTLAVKSKVSVFVDLFRQRKVLGRQLEALEHSRQEQELLLSQLQVARCELEHAVRMRDDFMSIVSHEVRTPLNGLILETQLRKMHLARGNLDAFSADKLQAMVERDERQINSLIRLVEDMLDVSRIRTGKLSLRPRLFDLGQLVRGLVENFTAQAMALDTHIELQRCEALKGEWDEFRIEQVVANLLSNAMRYGERNPVQVRVFEQEGMAWVQVQDHASVSAPPTSSGSSSNSSGSLPSKPAGAWAWGCTSPSRSCRRTVAGYGLKARKARAPHSPCNCRWQHSKNKTTRLGQPLRKPGV